MHFASWTGVGVSMSTLYNIEPQPTAKVLLQTTSGDILLELFAKQTPLASRNFLQLCLDGYYNGTIFHRLLPGFVIQGGDPTGSGEGGEAIYDGGTFADEFHNRLRFNRRGLLGMANSGQKDDNGSQFFITLGKTEELDGKNTMFGRVVGNTLFNVMRMGEAELVDIEGSERPLYPSKITGAEILVNPFDGMVPRRVVPKAMPTERDPIKKKAKKKGGKALLSFGAEDGDDAQGPVLKRAKFNPELVASRTNKEEANGKSIKAAVTGSTGEDRVDESHVSTDHMPAKTKQRRVSRSKSPKPVVRPNTHPETQLPLPKEEEPSRSPSSSPEPANVSRMSSLLEKTNAQIAELKASMKRNIPTTVTETGRKKSALEQLVPENAVRGRKRHHAGRDGGQNEIKTLKLLNAFRAKLDKVPAEIDHSNSPEQDTPAPARVEASDGTKTAEDDEEAHLCDLHFIANCQSCQSWEQQTGDAVEEDDPNDKGWMSHSLNFEKDRFGKDLNWKKKNEEDLVVIDPREKAKDIKEEQRAKKRAQGGGRAWDRDRDRGRQPERLAGARG